MKKQSYKTWLFKEAMRLAGTDKRSVKEIIKGGFRARMYMAILNYSEDKLIALNTSEANDVNNMIYKIKNNDKELTNEFKKSKELYETYLHVNEKTKLNFMEALKEYETSMALLEELNIKYSNYHSFMNGKLNSLSLEKVRKLFMHHHNSGQKV